MGEYRIRAATSADLRHLAEIERDAAQLYRDVGYDFCADGSVRDENEIRRAFSDGAIQIAETLVGKVVGFALLWRVDGDAHLLELSVSRQHQRQGLGRRLMRSSEERARDNGFTHLTLTTYRDVLWNAPFYRELGFCAFEPESFRQELSEIQDDERRHGFAVRPRVAMRKSISAKISR